MSFVLYDSLCDEFLNLISKEKILNFQNECNNYLDNNNQKFKNKIPKNIFIILFQKLFSSLPCFTPLYEIIFEKFKCKKLIFKTEKKKELYSLNDILSTDEIDINKIPFILLAFYKSDFDNKIKILFDLNDLDYDGLINEIEIKKMIYSFIILFSQNECQFKTQSNLIQRSLANSKANKVYFSIMYTPGGLLKILNKEKYINFETFYSSISKIKDYKFNLFPFHLSFKDFFSKSNSEIEYSLSQNLIPEFLSISNSYIQKLNSEEKYNFNKDNNKLNSYFDVKVSSKKKNIIPIFKLELRKKQNLENIFHKENIKDKKKNLLNCCSTSNIKYINPIIKNQTESYLDISTNESNISQIKNNLNSKEFKYEKADFDKFRILKFPPCKLVSLNKKSKVVLPNLISNKNENETKENNSLTLKSIQDIYNEINKIYIKKHFFEENKKYNLKPLEEKIIKRAYSMKKLFTNENKIISNKFFKYYKNKKKFK